nr:ATP-binding cassette domain-containing protein [Kineococcus aurantiacus]
MRAGGRTVYSGVDLDVAEGSVLVVRGRAGQGKTSLLLTLAGRMRPTAGHLAVLGEPLPARAGAVRRRVALAEVRGVNDLDDALTVEQHVAERLVLHQPWHRPWVSDAQVGEQLERAGQVLARTADAGADVPALRPREFVSDLDPLERMTLGVVLALIGRPDVLVVDDVDSLRRGEDRRRAWASLAALRGTTPLTVVASCSDTSDVRWRSGDHHTLLDLADR